MSRIADAKILCELTVPPESFSAVSTFQDLRWASNLHIPPHFFKANMDNEIDILLKEIEQAKRDLDDHIDFNDLENNLLAVEAYAYLAIAKANLTSLKFNINKDKQ